MDIAQLHQHLSNLYTENAQVEIIIYTLLKNKDELPKKLDIKNDDLPNLRSLFLDSINSLILQKNGYTIIPISTADDRSSCFYKYDLDVPEDLLQLENVIGNDNIKTFNFSSNKLEDIDSLVILLRAGDNVFTLFKKLSAVEVLGRSGFILWEHDERLEKMEDQMLRISPKFQVIRVNNELIVLDLKTIERSFGFYDAIKKQASLGLKAIESLHIVSNIESLTKMLDDVSFARKLTKVYKDSPIIKMKIPNDRVITFAKNHPATSGKMKYTDDDKQFNLTNIEHKKLFVRILNDDLLKSDLTKLHYEALAKDGFKSEVVTSTSSSSN